MENRPIEGLPKGHFWERFPCLCEGAHTLSPYRIRTYLPTGCFSPCTGSTRLTTISEVWAPQVLSPTTCLFSGELG